MGRLTISGATHNFEFDLTGKNLLSELLRIIPKDELPEGVSYANLDIYIGSQLIDIRAYDINRVFTEDVRIIVNPKGLETATIVGIVSIVLTAASIAASFILAPKLPNAQQQSDSPNNGFFGQKNTIRLDALEPDIYGTQVSYPDLIVNEGGAWSYVDNQKIVDEVFLVGIGSYEVSEPRFEDTPFSTITGQSYDYYGPGDLVPVVQGQFNSEFIDGQTLIGPNNDEAGEGISATADPIVGTMDINASDILSVEVTKTADWDAIYSLFTTEVVTASFTYEAFRQQDALCLIGEYNSTGVILTMVDNGSTYSMTLDAAGATKANCPSPDNPEYGTTFSITTIEGASVSLTMPIKTNEVQVSFEFRSGLRGNVDIAVFIAESTGVERYDFNYSANTINQLFFSEKIAISPPTGDLTVTMVRLNNDKDDNTDRAQVSQVATNSYRYNVDYGDRTILKTSRKATEQALTLKDSKVNADVTRKTISYVNGAIDYTLTASRSFADAMLHEYTQVFGLSADDLPLDELYQINDSIPTGLNHFDYTFSDKENDIKSILDTICNVARCQMTFTGQGYEICRDEAQAVSAQFDSRNIAMNSPEETSYRGAVETSNNGIKLKWKSPITNKYEYVNYTLVNGVSTKCVYNGNGTYNPSLPTIPLEIDLVGCSELAQADDRADLECRKLVFIQKTLRTTVLKDGQELARGQVVRHSDYWQNDVTSGELSAINGGIFTTFNEIDLPKNDYFVTYNNEYGESFGPVECTIIDGNNFMANMPESYLADGYSIQSGTRYIISTLDEHNNNLYVVNDKEVNQDGTVSLELMQYDESIYPEED